MDTTAIDAWLDALNNTIGEFGTALSAGAETALEQFRADAHGFYVAVNWHEDRWILGIFAVEALLFCVILACRRRTAVLVTLFAVITASTSCGEYLNTLASRHWRSFASIDYFDKHGVFWAVVVGMPCILLALTIIFALLASTIGKLVEVKKKELRQKKKVQ
jgi:hypothetical protein